MLPAKKTSKAMAKSGAFGRAVERFKAKREADRRIVRIGFIVDATGSRENSWEQAQTVQGRMFEAVTGLAKVKIRLAHFGGNELTDHGWTSDTRRLAAKMAAVRCRSGLTQILTALRTLTLEEEHADAIILVGDAFEENAEEIGLLTQIIRPGGTKVFSFFEGDNQAAQAAFERLARETGGRFAKFGEELPLHDLCEGVALLTAGGKQAAGRLTNKKVRQLLLTGPSSKQ